MTARSYVEFTLREAARFSDGNPVTVEDVLWSFETLGTEGNPRYAGAWKKIATGRKDRAAVGAGSPSTSKDRELPLILGLRPILEKAQWEDKDFTASTLEAPIGSGPYVVDEVRTRHALSAFARTPTGGGAICRSIAACTTLMKSAPNISVMAAWCSRRSRQARSRPTVKAMPAKWQSNYDFPAMQSGDDGEIGNSASAPVGD